MNRKTAIRWVIAAAMGITLSYVFSAMGFGYALTIWLLWLADGINERTK